MFYSCHLNQRSRELIQNIWINAKNHPMYASYDICLDEASYFNAGAIALNIVRNGNLYNMFLFYPNANNDGSIGSVAIYGGSLIGHKQAIERSMQLFGLPVESVKWDEGYEKFLDVTLKPY